MIRLHSARKWPAVFSLCICLSSLSSCNTSRNSRADSELRSTASPADKFSSVTTDRFNLLLADQRAEFLGCLCIANQGKWAAWKFIKVANKGYRTEVAATIHDDIESCVSEREHAAQQCGG